MKKISILFLMAILAFLPLRAQITHTANGNVDANAQKVLSKASTKFNTGSVSFSVVMVSTDDKKKETSHQQAQVLYSQGRYRVNSDNQVLYCDGKNVYLYDQKAKEVTISPASDAEDDLMNPGNLLANYSKHYKAKFIRTENDGTSVIDLTPKKSKSFYKIRLLVASSGQLKSLTMHQYDGSYNEFKVNSFKSGIKASDADFRFDAESHKGVEVIDMR